MLETTEDKVALVLVILGVIMLGAYGIMDSDGSGGLILLLVYGVYAVVSVVAGVAAAFATAWMLGASFGFVGPAILKLSAIIVFSTAVSVVVPFGGLLGLLVYVGLLVWFFELSPFEVFVFVLVLAGLRFVLAIGLAMMLAAAMGAVL